MKNLFIALFWGSCLCFPTFAKNDVDKPALVVVVSVDQWRYEYFERFQRNLPTGGIAKRTQNHGAWFDNCFHQHAFTYTGPGHSVFMTGAYPSRSGIIDNNWHDRATGKDLYCVADEDANIIGSTTDEPKASPRNLLVDTVGDQLKLSSNFRSKVFGVAIKDRAAILMAGRLADAAYWMSSDGKWITTDHYRDSLPGYLRTLNEQKAPYRYAGRAWDLHYDADKYAHGSQEHSEHELPQYEMTKDFPHVMPAADNENYIKHLACSPFGNEATFEAAREILVNEDLGRDEYPDILAINLSSTDYVGHAFGPYSLEVEDMTYRTDQQLGEFTRFLDERLGNRSWVLFLTADHGVAPIPERAADWKLRAKRFPLGEMDDNSNIEEMRQKLDAVLRVKLGLEPAEIPLVTAFVSNQVFLNKDHPALAGTKIELARRLASDYLSSHPYIAYAVTRERLLQDCSGNKMLQMIQRSFHTKRSGDVLYVLKPYHISSTSAATHGSPWQYDRHVPLMIVGNHQNLMSGDTEQFEVSPASIAPTITRLLKIENPSGCMERRLDLRQRR